jgi:ATP-dependent protease HslVU (ClpYQ) peptidase subunit
VTVIIALVGEEYNYLAADSRAVLGGLVNIGDNYQKIIQIGEYYCAFSGSALLNQEAQFKKQGAPLRIRYHSDVCVFINWIRELMAEARIAANDRYAGPPSYDFSCIIVSPYGVWSICQDLTFYKVKTYDSIGSGSMYALGYIDGVLSNNDFWALAQKDYGVKLLKETIRYVYKRVVNCGGRVRIHSVERRS